MTQDKLNAFFAEHPEATTAFVCLGCAFPTVQEAKDFLAGINGVSISQYSKEGKLIDGGEAGQQADATTEGTGTGSNATGAENTNTQTGQPPANSEGQKALDEFVGKPAEEIEEAIKAQELVVEGKKQEVAAAKGFGKNKPKAELADAESRLAGLRTALEASKLPQ